MIDTVASPPASPLTLSASARLLALGRLSLTRSCLRRISPVLAAWHTEDPALSYLPALVREAVARQGGDAGGALLLWAALSGQRQDAELLSVVLPGLSVHTLLAVVTGSCTGDIIKVLLALIESERLDGGPSCVALFLIRELLEDQPPPPLFIACLRSHARGDHGAAFNGYVAHALARIDDPEVRKLAPRLHADLRRPSAQRGMQLCRRALRTPDLSYLPEEAPLVQGLRVTLRRPAARIGRNDPCPCGSGKKYKRCCSEKAPDASPLAGVPLADYRARADLHVPLAQWHNLSFNELALFDLTPLPPPYLEAAFYIALAYRNFEYAERILGLLEEKEYPPLLLDGLRGQLISQAIASRDVATLQRQSGRLQHYEFLRPADWVGLAVLANFPDAVSLLEQACRMVLVEAREDSVMGLAHALLVHSPALGILVARGAVDGSESKKIHELLEAVEKARDRLALPIRDRAWGLHDRLVAWRIEERVDARARTVEVERLQSQAYHLTRQVQESTSRVVDLERRLRQQEDALHSERQRLEAHRRGEDDPTEQRRLQGTIARLKGLIAEGNGERAELRARLAEMSDDLSRAAALRPREDDAEPEVAEEDDEAEGEAESEAGEICRGILCPVLSKAAQGALRVVPARVAREALLSMAEIAGGEPAAWRGVKRLKAVVPAMAPMWSVRVGIHYRLLFRVRDESLDVLELIHRRDLELTLKQRRWA